MAGTHGTASKRSASRVSVDDWIQAGYAILAEEGIKALKLDRLCERLGVTKGSFYWHFDGMPRYRAALIAAWGELRDEDRRSFDDMADLDPRERLARMMSALVSPRHWTLERAMREWARLDESVAASVRASDGRVLQAVRQAFLDYGFDADEAELPRKRRLRRGNRVPASVCAPPPAHGKRLRGERFLDLVLAR